MKVLLVNPSKYFGFGYEMAPPYPPLGLLYIAAVFEEADCEVRVVDMDAEKLSLSSLGDEVKKFQPDIVGITSMTPAFGNALAIAGISKSVRKSAQVVVGGIHATIAPREVMGDANVDFVVEGEGEAVVKEFVAQLRSCTPDFAKVNGLWHKHNGGISGAPRPAYISDLNTLRFPAWHLLKNPFIYTGQDVLRLPMATIITSRGCPGRCTYCQSKQIFGRSFRYRSADNIVGEIDELVRRFKIREIHIADDVFTLHKERVLEFCGKIKARGYNLVFQLPNGVRADMIDEDILKALKSIGLVNVSIGVETGSEAIRGRIKKDEITREQIAGAFKMAKRLGFETWGFFIFGLPGENAATARETIDFAKELDPDFAKFIILMPFPGSEVFVELHAKGLIFDHNYDHYGFYAAPVHRLEDMSAEDISYWQKRAFREFYFRPGKLLRAFRRKWTPVRIKKTFDNIMFLSKRVA
jgi:anaerobic magnesium-protoporphyrin IX monomethyl ester cyclase